MIAPRERLYTYVHNHQDGLCCMPGWEQPPLLEERTNFRGAIGERRTRALRFKTD